METEAGAGRPCKKTMATKAEKIPPEITQGETMNKEELEKLLEKFKGELLDRLDQIEGAKAVRGLKPPPISPEKKEHNAAGITRTFRKKKGKGPLGRASIRIEPDLLEAAKTAAEKERLSLSGWICELVRKELNK